IVPANGDELAVLVGEPEPEHERDPEPEPESDNLLEDRSGEKPSSSGRVQVNASDVLLSPETVRRPLHAPGTAGPVTNSISFELEWEVAPEVE
ncbi:hypothetical protein NL529_27700, partial [Klebsiella pneumoniae]|nr:hypothetical protein [Klebsiella pneumoniae]